MSAGKICCREVYLADPVESVRAAAQRMFEQGIGSLLIVNEARQPVGVVTDRDIATRVVAPGRSPDTTLVRDVMTRAPRTVREQTPIEDVLTAMRGWGVRRLPVVTPEGQLVGLVTFDDVVDLLAEEMADVGQILARQKPEGPTRPFARVGGD